MSALTRTSSMIGSTTYHPITPPGGASIESMAPPCKELEEYAQKLNVPFSSRFQLLCQDGQTRELEIFLSYVARFSPNKYPSHNDDYYVYVLLYSLSAEESKTNNAKMDIGSFVITYYPPIKPTNQMGSAIIQDIEVNVKINCAQIIYKIFDLAVNIRHREGMGNLLFGNNCMYRYSKLFGVTAPTAGYAGLRLSEQVSQKAWREGTKNRLIEGLNLMRRSPLHTLTSNPNVTTADIAVAIADSEAAISLITASLNSSTSTAVNSSTSSTAPIPATLSTEDDEAIAIAALLSMSLSNSTSTAVNSSTPAAANSSTNSSTSSSASL